jgi:hypothetical protein
MSSNFLNAESPRKSSISEKIDSWLTPANNDILKKAQGRLVIVSSLCVALALSALVAWWIISGSLESLLTVRDTLGIDLLCIGIAFLAKRGKVTLAAWLIALPLGAVILLNTGYYGLTTASNAAFVIPIILASCAIGSSAGVGFALLGCTTLWWVGLSAQAGMIQTATPFDISDLTFTAPTYTLIYLLSAGLLAIWNRQITR